MSSKKIKHYTVDEILTYLDCSLCHHIKYNLKLKPPEEILTSQKNIFFKESIHLAVAYYYQQLQQENVPELKSLYNKFYKAWLHKTDTKEDASILTRDLENSGHIDRRNESNYITKGYKWLQQFYQYNSQIEQSIIASNYSYELVFGDSIIDGEIPLIREVDVNGRKEIQLVLFSLSQKNLNQQSIKNNFTNMLHAFAFQQLLKIHPDRIVSYQFNKSEETTVSFSTNDYKRLLNILESFFQSVDNVKPYPTTSVHTYSTLYKNLCDNYNYIVNPLN